MKKTILLICDGLADRPHEKLNNLTPLESADTPNLDYLATNAQCGMMHTIGRGIVPGSDTAHLSLMGYDPKIYYRGRGPIEAAGLGFELKDGDIALRGNMGTVDENSIIIDRRAGRIRDVSPFMDGIEEITIDDIKFITIKGTAHRVVLVMRGKNLSDQITNIDPKKTGVKLPKSRAIDANDVNAIRTANALNKYVEHTCNELNKNPENEKRKLNGDLVANAILLRGQGTYNRLPSFLEKYELKSACVAGGGLYKGIGFILGMDVIEVEGANALPDTNIKAKFNKAVSLLEGDYDFVFIHVKATDSLGEDKKPIEKRDFIKRIDDATEIFTKLNLDDFMIVITADHSTPCTLGTHSADPVPIMYSTNQIRHDSVKQFNETVCSQGGLGFIEGKDLMPEVLNILGKLKYYGA
jgi:2,3-bisphosphoglycerate-independent phosphoglycerate mutase